MKNFYRLHAPTLILALALILGCKQQAATVAGGTEAQFSFEVLTASRTGLQFANTLQPTAQFNMFNYMYFYNGSGVGVADVNNDGLPDVFFAGNQQRNRLYLNKGNLTFEDITDASGIPNDGAWSTGVSFTDINNDSLPDIYVCRASNFEKQKKKNLLLVCKGVKNGIPYYEEEAANYGLDFSGLSTQAAFF